MKQETYIHVPFTEQERNIAQQFATKAALWGDHTAKIDTVILEGDALIFGCWCIIKVEGAVPSVLGNRPIAKYAVTTEMQGDDVTIATVTRLWDALIICACEELAWHLNNMSLEGLTEGEINDLR